MPNGYSVVPSIIPGGLQVQGDLTVVGNGVFGTGTRKARIGQNSSLDPLISFNLGFDMTTRDDAAQQAYLNRLITAGLAPVWAQAFVNKAGSVASAAVLGSYPQPFNQLSNTGNTTENQVTAQIITARLLGTRAGIRLWFKWDQTTQGGVASSLRLKLGATTIATIANATVVTHWIELVGWSNGATNAQLWVVSDYKNGVAPAVTFANSAIDTTADQNFFVTIQNGANTDVNVVGPGLALLVTEA